jgi:hypothetical protein
MAWQLGSSPTTAGLINEPTVGAYANLLPGDALVYRSGSSGHAILFTGWKDSSKKDACVLHEAGTSTGMKFGSWTASNLQSSGYKAIRKPGLGSSAGDVDAGSCGRNACGPPAARPTGSPTTCLSTGGVCNSDAECCSQSCASHRCGDLPVPPVPPAGGTSGANDPPPVICGSERSGCIVDANCCVGTCIDWQCSSTGSTCQGAAGSCLFDVECCSGACVDGLCN